MIGQFFLLDKGSLNIVFHHNTKSRRKRRAYAAVCDYRLNKPNAKTLRIKDLSLCVYEVSYRIRTVRVALPYETKAQSPLDSPQVGLFRPSGSPVSRQAEIQCVFTQMILLSASSCEKQKSPFKAKENSNVVGKGD